MDGQSAFGIVTLGPMDLKNSSNATDLADPVAYPVLRYGLAAVFYIQCCVRFMIMHARVKYDGYWTPSRAESRNHCPKIIANRVWKKRTAPGSSIGWRN